MAKKEKNLVCPRCNEELDKDDAILLKKAGELKCPHCGALITDIAKDAEKAKKKGGIFGDPMLKF